MAYSAPGFRKCGSRRRRRRSFKGSSVSFTLSISHVSIRTVVPRGGKSFFFFIRFPLPLQTLKGVSTHTTTILERGESEDGRGDGLLWGGGGVRDRLKPSESDIFQTRREKIPLPPLLYPVVKSL